MILWQIQTGFSYISGLRFILAEDKDGRDKSSPDEH